MAHELSVIIPVLNEEAYIGRLLDCLAQQDYVDFEIVVADSASEDKTVEVAKSYGDRLDLSVVEQQTGLKGVSYARNLGAARAEGEFLLFLDADGVFSDDFLRIMVSEFKRRRLGIATARFWINSAHPLDVFGACLVAVYAWAVEHTAHPLAGGYCIMVKREYHEKIGGFDPTYTLAEDHQYAAAVVAAGGAFAYIRKTKIIFEMRRFIEEGRGRVFSKWIRSELYRRTHGYRVDKDFKYGFGQHKPSAAKPKDSGRP